MYTQCVKCDTVFRLAAETLRAAGGQVRCGRCGEVFNALTRLAEDPSSFPPKESPFEMETRANQILESAVSPPRGEVLQVVERFAQELAGPAAMGTGTSPAPPPPAQLRPAPARTPAKPAAAAPTARPTPADVPDDELMEFTLPPGELGRVFVEQAPHVGTSLEISEDVRREMLSGFQSPEVPEEPALPDLSAAPRRSLEVGLWLAGAAILALLLCAQWVHANREWLGLHAPAHGPLHQLFSTFGATAAAAPDLSAYQLRQWGVTGDPNASGTLRVRASILNTAAQLQPYPLLRVTLANRFGAKIGTRDFEPAEYMGKPVARMLAPGERADATIDILDPGKDAEGFEIDVCLRSVNQKISCAGDAAAHAAAATG